MLIVLNNKCNLTKEEFLFYQHKLNTLANENIILCPSTIHIPNFKSHHLILGAQNVSSNEMGAYTGEISASQLASFNVKYCLVGHSERRVYQKEEDSDINKKIKLLLKEKIIPILCIGETKEEKTANKTKEVLTKELENALKDIATTDKEKLIIAYEPVWSIGTGLIPTTEDLTEILKIVKELLPKNKLLYGGSVTEENITMLKNCPLIDGYLLGGLSLKVSNLKDFLTKLTY